MYSIESLNIRTQKSKTIGMFRIKYESINWCFYLKFFFYSSA